MQTTNFQIKIESSDNQLAFEESKSLRKFLENGDFENDLEVKQSRKKLDADDAGGVMESAVELICALPAILQVGSAILFWYKNRNKKTAAEDKPVKIIIQSASGEIITLDAAQIGAAGPTDKEILANLVKLLQIGNGNG